MNDLAELQRRKAALKIQLDRQRTELKATMAEIRKEFEPANLLKKAVGGALGFSEKRAGEGLPSLPGGLPLTISILADLLIKNPKWSLAVKWLAPILLNLIPKTGKTGPKPDQNGETEAAENSENEIYGQLRRSISGLLGRLRKAEKGPEKPQAEIVEPSEN